jgi:hypothetical protein
MVWSFSLAVECGESEAGAAKFCQHFQGNILNLDDGSSFECRGDIFQDLDDNWWCRVCPQGISLTGINTPETAYLMTEIGISLYRLLQSAPDFRFALVGVEVDEFRTYTELIEDRELLAVLFPGLVLANPVWKSIGSPGSFRKFAGNYVWQSYGGEVYRPLRASVDLTERLDRLSVV